MAFMVKSRRARSPLMLPEYPEMSMTEGWSSLGTPVGRTTTRTIPLGTLSGASEPPSSSASSRPRATASPFTAKSTSPSASRPIIRSRTVPPTT